MLEWHSEGSPTKEQSGTTLRSLTQCVYTNSDRDLGTEPDSVGLHCKDTDSRCVYLPKVGIRNLSPQYRGQPYWLRSCGLKKVAELRLRTFKIWLPQFRNFPQSAASPLLSSPVSSAQDGFKNQTKNIFRIRVSLKTRNFPWRDVSTRFLSQIFSLYESTGFYIQNYAEKCGIKAPKLRTWNCGLQKKLRLRILRNCGCGATCL
jgi:hypothetical protein